MSREHCVGEMVDIDADGRVKDYFNVGYTKSKIVNGIDIQRTTINAIYKNPEAALRIIKIDKALSRFLFDLDAGVKGAVMGTGGCMAMDGISRALTGDEFSMVVGLAELFTGLNFMGTSLSGVVHDWGVNASAILRENVARRSVEEKAIKAYLQQKKPEE